MEHFLINSSVCLFVLWLFYKLALENTSWHNWKRFYLLSSVVVSFIIPFIVVETIIVPVQENTINFINLQNAEYGSEKPYFEIQWYSILMTIYVIGVAVMLWRFAKNLSTFKIKNEDEISKYNIYQLILRPGITVPHSFFNRIFVSAKDYKNNWIPKAVLDHEKAHLDQKHSLDILLIELLIVLFWFNPIFYILRYSIKLNHEFLADKSVIQQGIPTTQYQELILQHATKSYQQSMANTFHFPIIKKRFNIMKTKTSITNGLLRSLAIIPIITILILSCGEEETQFEIENQQELIEVQTLTYEETYGKKPIIILNNKSKGKVKFNKQEYTFQKEDGEYQFFDEEGILINYKKLGYEIIEINEVLLDLTAKDIEEYNSLAKKYQAYVYKKKGFIVGTEETKRMQIIYNSMTKEQRANNERWPFTFKVSDLQSGEIPPPPTTSALNKTMEEVDKQF